MKLLALAASLALATSAIAQDASVFNLQNNQTASAGEGAPVCGEFVDYQQPLGLFGSARTSDVQVALNVAEDIVDGTMITTLPAGTVAGLRFWGLSLEFDPALGFVGQCLADNTAGTPYNFNFYADNAGVPGALLGSSTGTPTATDTGTPFALGANVFQYDVQLPAPVSNTDVSWVSIQRQTGQQAASGNDCYFLWVNETDATTYDNFAIEVNGGATAPNDQTMCLLAGPSDADVSITKTTQPAAGTTVGSSVTFTLNASNAGPGDAENVVVTDNLPLNLNHTSNTCGATVNGRMVTWNIGTLANGAAASCDIVTSIADRGPINNTATIATSTNDPTPDNNSGLASAPGAPFLPATPIPASNYLMLLLAGLLVAGLGIVAARRF